MQDYDITWQKPNFDLFLSLWNQVHGNKTPKHHFQIARWLQAHWMHGRTRLLLQAFRASGKSSLAGLLIPWLLHRDPDLRILVIAAEANLAFKMSRNVRTILRNHPLTKSLVPTKPELWAADQFTINRLGKFRDPSVRAVGLFGNMTGSRADFIICDDVEVPNTCDTPDKRAILRDRLAETEFILNPGGTILYIGTPHCYESIYADTPRTELGEDEIFLKNFERLTIPVLSEAGESNWPERFTLDHIEAQRLQTGPMKFAAQMMLQPVNSREGRLNVKLLQRYDAPLIATEIQQQLYLSIEGKKLVSASAWWDPAFGSTDGDGSVLAVIFTDEEGNRYLHHIAYIRAENDELDEAQDQCLQVAAIAKEFYLPAIHIETNGIGKFLPAILRKILAQQKIPCSVIEEISRSSKDSRILEGFDAVMAAHSLYVREDIYQTPFIREMNEWRPGLSAAKDDGLDATAGALLAEPVRIRRAYFSGRQGWQGSGKQTQANTDFNV